MLPPAARPVAGNPGGSQGARASNPLQNRHAAGGSPSGQRPASPRRDWQLAAPLTACYLLHAGLESSGMDRARALTGRMDLPPLLLLPALRRTCRGRRVQGGLGVNESAHRMLTGC